MLTDLLNQQIRLENELERAQHTRIHIYPSEIAKCSRAIWYRLTGTVATDGPTDKALRIFANGDSVHARYQLWIKAIDPTAEIERPIEIPELMVSGRIDAVATINNTQYIIEIKSANDRAWSKCKQTGRPKWEHTCQVQLYMGATGIHDGIILVENKNDQELLELPISFDPDIYSRLVSKCQAIVDHYRAGTAPEQEYLETSYECRYCDYRDYCHCRINQF